MMMQVTGYRLRAAIKAWEVKRDAAVKQLPDSFFAFKGENKKTTIDLMLTVQAAEDAIARLQAIQAQYNSMVHVTVGDVEMSLSEAVKRLGGANRVEKLWRQAAGLEKKDRYGYSSDSAPTRRAGEEVAERTMSLDEAAQMAAGAAEAVTALQTAIAEGNGRNVEMPVEGLL